MCVLGLLFRSQLDKGKCGAENQNAAQPEAERGFAFYYGGSRGDSESLRQHRKVTL